MTLYEACLTLLQVYSRNNLGRQRIDVTAEEEQYQDLLLIMELLTNLLSKEFIDFSDAGEPWATGLQLLLVLLKQRWSIHRPAGGLWLWGGWELSPFRSAVGFRLVRLRVRTSLRALPCLFRSSWACAGFLDEEAGTERSCH